MQQFCVWDKTMIKPSVSFPYVPVDTISDEIVFVHFFFYILVILSYGAR